ncbi:hypothetical protein LX16_0344 [Stackebrandtia albiflava]|uniref:Uncharacterized protein n=2 Tax=Stackebrandtia albiflava TaxID=406432 RepID=A0A562VA18_9ACTN|nr:hypothetical protein LX16_0344 [Stackebrandtia albiflava]
MPGYGWHILGQRLGVPVLITGFAGSMAGDDILGRNIFLAAWCYLAVVILSGHWISYRLYLRRRESFPVVLRGGSRVLIGDVFRLRIWRPRAWRAMAGE